MGAQAHLGNAQRFIDLQLSGDSRTGLTSDSIEANRMDVRTTEFCRQKELFGDLTLTVADEGEKPSHRNPPPQNPLDATSAA